MDKVSKALISIAEFDGFVKATESLAQIKIPPTLARSLKIGSTRTSSLLIFAPKPSGIERGMFS